jgi:hypothetical protein
MVASGNGSNGGKGALDDRSGTRGYQLVGRPARKKTSFAQKRGQTPAPWRLKSWFAHPVGGQSPFWGKAQEDLNKHSEGWTGQLPTP